MPDFGTKKYTAVMDAEYLLDAPRNILPTHDEKILAFAFASSDVTQELEDAMDALGPKKYKIVIRFHDRQTCFGYHLRISPRARPADVYAELKWTDIERLRLANELTLQRSAAASDSKTIQSRKTTEITEADWKRAKRLGLFIDHASMINSLDDTLKRHKSSSKTAIDKEQYKKVFRGYDQIF